MPESLDRNRVGALLRDCALQRLFVEELGWDHGGEDRTVTVGGSGFALEALAHKRGLVAYQCVADSTEAFPDHHTRQKIERDLAKAVREHLIVYVSQDRNSQHWQWVKREPGRPDGVRAHVYSRDQSGEALIQKLERIAFTLEEEADASIVEASARVRAAFDVEKVTKRFYDRFKKEHHAFLQFMEGIRHVADREWYASLMLNRMMFIYFIQKRGFLDGDADYLRNRLRRMQERHGKNRFQTFYRLFLLRLFHEGLGQPETERSPELAALLGKVPYLNGGLFDVHDLERNNPGIHIPDEAFEQIFAFFAAYQWHLDDRPLRRDNEINPDVLGYIFEKYINQKQMGAYYTKEDITGYIGRNTIIPFLFDQAKKACAIAFKPNGGVWALLSEDPDRYFYEAVRHGVTYDLRNGTALGEERELPREIAAGLDDVAQRGGWSRPAPPEYALPTETWREHVARRRRYEEVRAKLAAGELTSINDLITYNLDIEKFAQDAITRSEGPELVRAFWKALSSVSILDPTCGSGAFLFAALNILEPLYVACLETMAAFVGDLAHSQRPHRPEKLRDFRAVLSQVSQHAGERYFTLKSIIVNNLYGVDIMEEAVEICKLRLFLKLVAQLDSYDQIEPLPDIDFNVRAGNTLVGFTSLNAVKRTLSDDLVKQLSLPEIEERAEVTDRAFHRFREMQTEHGMDAGAFAETKMELRKRLDALRDELDGYLAGDYGVKVNDRKAYRQWRGSHQPFHWLVEFYGIMNGGGFDVIIGNPPYISAREVRKSYVVKDVGCENCPDIYASILARAQALLGSGGRTGMIVPLSLTFSQAFDPCRQLLFSDYAENWFSSFGRIPSALFSFDVRVRNTIHLASKSKNKSYTRTTRLHRWFENERPFLFQTLEYGSFQPMIWNHRVPKLGRELIREFEHLFVEHKLTLESAITKSNTPYVLHFKQTAYNWLNFCRVLPPCYGNRRRPIPQTKFGSLYFDDDELCKLAMLLANGKLMLTFWFAVGDDFDVTQKNFADFPADLRRMPKNLKRQVLEIYPRLDAAMQDAVQFKKNAGKQVGTYNLARCRTITDRSDRLFCDFWGIDEAAWEDIELHYVQTVKTDFSL